MKTISVGIMSFLLVTLQCGPAAAWFHGNRFGGGTSHSYGDTSHTSGWGTSTSHSFGEGTSHTNVYGGTTAHAYGEGTEHTNTYGGSAEHYEGGGWSKTNTYGNTAYGNAHYGSAYYHPPVPYAGYHPPTVVDHYSSGCYNCGGWSTGGAALAGAAVGMVTGAALASENTAAETSNAYNAGVATGSTYPTYVMGATYTTLPGGCATPNVRGQTYYLCGNNWFQPSYGANGVYYRMVPAP